MKNNMNRITSILTLMLSTILAGCAGVGKGRPDRPGYEEPRTKALISKYSPPNSIPSQTTADQRNEILDDLMYLIDVNYDRFEGEIERGKSFFEIGTDLGMLGLGAAGALHPAGAATQVLAAISGGLAGTRTTVNKNIFREKSIQALTSEMRAARAKQRDLIQKSMLLDARQYSLSRGMSDLIKYYNAGTFSGALDSIVAEAGERERQSSAAIEKRADKAIESKYSEDAITRPLRDRINNWLLQNPGARVAPFQAWLTAKPNPSALSPSFWVDAETTTATELIDAILQFQIP